MTHVWVSVASAPPPEGEPVMTKIDDANWGARNIQPLIRDDRLWWIPDRGMYVYYTPTHWRPMTTEDR